MTEPIIILILASIAIVLLTLTIFKGWTRVLLIPIITALMLLIINLSAGWPTTSPFPERGIIYKVVPHYVWAAPIDEPRLPRAYVFDAPPEWYEEQDRREGKPFEVERLNEEAIEIRGGNEYTRGEYIIHEYEPERKEN